MPTMRTVASLIMRKPMGSTLTAAPLPAQTPDFFAPSVPSFAPEAKPKKAPAAKKAAAAKKTAAGKKAAAKTASAKRGAKKAAEA